MASGRSSSHWNRFRPGKRYMVTSHAVPVPIRRVSAPTPAISSSVRRNAPGSTLAMRCGQVSPLDWSASTKMASTGAMAISEMRDAATDQAKLPLSRNRATWRRIKFGRDPLSCAACGNRGLPRPTVRQARQQPQARAAGRPPAGHRQRRWRRR